MHFLKSKKAITKPELFLALLLSLATIIGCNSKAATDAGSTEADQSQEVLSSNEISGNTVSSNTVSNHEVSFNTISNNSVKEEGPVFTKSLTEEEIEEINNPAFEELTNNPPVDGIYNPDYDFSKSDSIYKNDKNYQREYYHALNYAYGAAAGNKSIEENRNYTAIICKKGFTIFAAEETLSIITLNDNLGEYYIIKDYKGEDMILKDSYLDFCTGDKLEENITNFNVTSMNDYLDKYYNGAYDRKPGCLLHRDYTIFAIAQYKNIGKAK